MGRFMKSGKVVLVLGGRYAGRKAVIVKVSLRNVACDLCRFYVSGSFLHVGYTNTKTFMLSLTHSTSFSPDPNYVFGKLNVAYVLKIY